MARVSGHDITFVVPKLHGDEYAPHMLLVDPERAARKVEKYLLDQRLRAKFGPFLNPDEDPEEGLRRVRLTARPGPYGVDDTVYDYRPPPEEIECFDARLAHVREVLAKHRPKYMTNLYGGDIFDEVTRFAANVLPLTYQNSFDIIHAHDWITFPAGAALRELSGKPLVVQVHSLEYDRSGQWGNPTINRIEAYGVTAADRVIAVSDYTRHLVCRQHGISLDKIDVAHNGIDEQEVIERHHHQSGDRIVLFLGRLTFQKGPMYFIEAAARVVPHVPNVKFVVAGAGDMLPQMMQRVQELGIRDRFLFTGFLRGAEVDRVFSAADLYVMPSVSEPFGLTALESIRCGTPVLISKQCGASEVIKSTLKFDFWDVDRLADLVINVLSHDELRQDLVKKAKQELHMLRWDNAAQRVSQVYEAIVRA
jgi:glycosyltransferase involved in cell wall biosynthesis